jgi:putative acetyltransferase
MSAAMPVAIRHEQNGDADHIRFVIARAFGGSNEAAIVDALRGAPGSLSLVAIVDGRIAGHIFFTPVQIDGAEPYGAALGLAPLAVLPERQRCGIGSALVRAGLDACRAAGCRIVVVLGHPEYYPRFGFAPASSAGLACEFPVPADAFMALELVPGALAGAGPERAHPSTASRTVRYHPRFSAG